MFKTVIVAIKFNGSVKITAKRRLANILNEYQSESHAAAMPTIKSLHDSWRSMTYQSNSAASVGSKENFIDRLKGAAEDFQNISIAVFEMPLAFVVGVDGLNTDKDSYKAAVDAYQAENGENAGLVCVYGGWEMGK